jgi:hypothetical protein
LPMPECVRFLLWSWTQPSSVAERSSLLLNTWAYAHPETAGQQMRAAPRVVTEADVHPEVPSVLLWPW